MKISVLFIMSVKLYETEVCYDTKIYAGENPNIKGFICIKNTIRIF
jgi:hypothetical protein